MPPKKAPAAPKVKKTAAPKTAGPPKTGKIVALEPKIAITDTKITNNPQQLPNPIIQPLEISSAQPASPYEKVQVRQDLVEARKGAEKAASKKRKYDTLVRLQKQRFVHVICFFTIVIAVMLTLIIAGGIFIFKPRFIYGDQDANPVMSLSDMCRQQYPDENRCITGYVNMTAGIPTADQACKMEKLCRRETWAFHQRTLSTYNFTPSFEKIQTILSLRSTNFAHCGSNRWCRDGSCEPLPDHHTVDKRWEKKPSINKGYSRWIEGGIVECIEPLPKQVNEFEEIKNKTSIDCNTEVCDKAAGAAKQMLKVRFRYCDLTDDRETGQMQRYCGGLPIKISSCGNCTNFDPQKLTDFKNSPTCDPVGSRRETACVQVCPGISKNPRTLPHGSECSFDPDKNGVCFYGYCYDLEP